MVRMRGKDDASAGASGRVLQPHLEVLYTSVLMVMDQSATGGDVKGKTYGFKAYDVNYVAPKEQLQENIQGEVH